METLKYIKKKCHIPRNWQLWWNVAYGKVFINQKMFCFLLKVHVSSYALCTHCRMNVYHWRGRIIFTVSVLIANGYVNGRKAETLLLKPHQLWKSPKLSEKGIASTIFNSVCFKTVQDLINVKIWNINCISDLRMIVKNEHEGDRRSYEPYF